MFQAAADWIYGIAAVLLLGAVALQAVPEGTYRKYVHLFLGGVLIVTMISPILSVLGLSQKTALYFGRDALAAWLGEIRYTAGGLGADGGTSGLEAWQEQVKKQREAALEQPLQVLAEEYGFSVRSYSAEWSEDGTELEQMALTVQRQTGEWDGREDDPDSGEGTENAGSKRDTIAQVEPVEEIRLSGDQGKTRQEGSLTENSASENETYYEPSELRDLHRALALVLELPEEQVIIYWNRR